MKLPPSANPVFFLLAWFARMFVVLAVVHWGLVGSAVLFSAPFEWAAELTFAVTAFIAIGYVGVLIALRHNEGALARMREGPSRFQKFSVWVVLAALASSAGGFFLQARGVPAVPLWSMGLGTVILLLETPVVIAAAVGANRRSGSSS